jgi:hypothetical protein
LSSADEQVDHSLRCACWTRSLAPMAAALAPAAIDGLLDATAVAPLAAQASASAEASVAVADPYLRLKQLERQLELLNIQVSFARVGGWRSCAASGRGGLWIRQFAQRRRSTSRTR